ncbi:hypothetical protein BVX97_00700 [bacterium E08(2017)]|nr:hypothetical protein BVX97_00700 [bacterium E08(2017)]
MRQSGSILIVALWALFFLGALAVSVGTRAAAGIRVAEHVKLVSRLNHVARAGVAQGIAAARSGNEEIMSGEASEYWSRANDSVAGGVFDVYSVVQAGDLGVVTNFGIISEGTKTNINNMVQVRSLLETVAEGASAALIEENIREYRKAKKTLTKGRSNGRFESIYELLLVDGVTGDLFESIEPVITIFSSDCYSGTAVARFSAPSGDEDEPMPERQIKFVYDSKKQTIVYWEQ